MTVHDQPKQSQQSPESSAPGVRTVNESTFKKLLKEQHVQDEELLLHSGNGSPGPLLAQLRRQWAPWYRIKRLDPGAVSASEGGSDGSHSADGSGTGGTPVHVVPVEDPQLAWEEHHAFQKLVDRVLTGKRQGIRATAARIIGPAGAHKWVDEIGLDPQLPVSELSTAQWIELYRQTQDEGFGNLPGGRSVGVDHKPRHSSSRQGAREPKLRW